ncbi:glutathione S-transferase family protein [Rhodovibrio salinarum]|uniref:Glutathione S-transferase family protein n=1 Tax=Rhodovibrio salinarum TaxID=1087 RepID=A0A934QGY7_9PROT|nr:glutathione S-transferase family protein [Rhodovibrio salinarum]MBK1696603.1 glutathione S-transferase family protein [Rhodovibrio salinarum]
MADYTLYYWPSPFRGQFVRAVLAHVEASWDEAGIEEVVALHDAEPAQQVVPHMGPPVLTDHAADFSLGQTPAILAYLGGKYGLIPGDPARAALTHKITADADDVLYEMTLHNGAQMWTQARWEAYRPRLGRWMAIFEEHGRRHGLTAEQGYLLGTDAPSLADLTTHILWGTMTSQLPALRPLLETQAPAIAALSDRIGQLPQQASLRAWSEAEYGDEWCSGQIEASLRAVL